MVHGLVKERGAELLREWLCAAERRMAMLEAVADLCLPDAWIAAGAVRNVAWDRLHDYPQSTPLTDVDVIWFDPTRTCRSIEIELERRLAQHVAGVNWSVKNQARMHRRNGDTPYRDCLDAMRAWPETATGIAARLGSRGAIELCAAFGFDDLLSLRLRPTPRFAADPAFHARVASKRWLAIWPRLHLVGPQA
jgi:uncharacterized protein